MEVKKYPEGSEGRDIIDLIVDENRSRNIDAYENARTLPPYYGRVNIGESPVTLATIKGKNNLVKSSILGGIFQSVENMSLREGKASIRTLGIEVRVDYVHPVLVKLVKVCVVSSYTTDPDVSSVLTEFSRQVLDNASKLCLPLYLPRSNKVQEVIADELNDYLRSLCVDNCIEFEENEGDTKQKIGGKISGLIRAAEG